MINTRGCAGAARRAGPGDAEQEARERGLVLGHPAGLREEADAHGAALLDREVPVPDAELEGVGPARSGGRGSKNGNPVTTRHSWRRSLAQSRSMLDLRRKLSPPSSK